MVVDEFELGGVPTVGALGPGVHAASVSDTVFGFFRARLADLVDAIGGASGVDLSTVVAHIDPSPCDVGERGALVDVCWEQWQGDTRVTVHNRRQFYVEVGVVPPPDAERGPALLAGTVAPYGTAHPSAILPPGGSTRFDLGDDWSGSDLAEVWSGASPDAMAVELVDLLIRQVPGGGAALDRLLRGAADASVFIEKVSDLADVLRLGEVWSALGRGDVATGIGLLVNSAYGGDGLNPELVELVTGSGLLEACGFDLSTASATYVVEEIVRAVIEYLLASPPADEVILLADLADALLETDDLEHSVYVPRIDPPSETATTTTSTTVSSSTTTTVGTTTTTEPPTTSGDIAYGQRREGYVREDHESLWFFDGTEGDEVVIDVIGVDGFDTWMELIGPDGTSIDTDDDSGTGADARIEAVLPETGDYTILVRGYSFSGGAFVVELEGTAGASDSFDGYVYVFEGIHNDIHFTNVVEGWVEQDSLSVWGLAGTPWNELSPNAVVSVHVMGLDGFDPVISVYGPEGDFLIEDDDGGPGSVSYVEFLPPVWGVYELRIHGYGGQSGSFRIEVELFIDDDPPDSTTTTSPPATTTTLPVDLGTGDVQVTLQWWSDVDLDLFVDDPTGATTSYSNPTSSSGGILDVDANYPCDTATTSPVENVYWPFGQSPRGWFEVEVHYQTGCGTAGTQTGRLAITIDGRVAEDFTFSIDPGGTFTHSFSY